MPGGLAAFGPGGQAGSAAADAPLQPGTNAGPKGSVGLVATGFVVVVGAAAVGTGTTGAAGVTAALLTFGALRGTVRRTVGAGASACTAGPAGAAEAGATDEGGAGACARFAAAGCGPRNEADQATAPPTTRIATRPNAAHGTSERSVPGAARSAPICGMTVVGTSSVWTIVV